MLGNKRRETIRTAGRGPRQRRRLALAGWMLTFAAMAVASGCGDKLPQTVPVEGRVIYHGQPVTRGTISFQSMDGSVTQPAIGALQPDGSYKLRTFQAKDGILPGKYAVCIKACNSNDFLFDPNAKPDLAVPLKYLKPETSGLTVEIPADAVGPLRFDFDLQD